MALLRCWDTSTASSNDGGKGLPSLGEGGSSDWACTQFLGLSVQPQAGRPTPPDEDFAGKYPQHPILLAFTLTKGCLDLL